MKWNDKMWDWVLGVEGERNVSLFVSACPLSFVFILVYLILSYVYVCFCTSFTTDM